MAGPWYVDSAAVGTGTGLSWTNACTKIATVLGKAVAAGDSIYVRNTHSETTAATVTWTFPGTTTSPNKVICADNTNSPPLSSDLSPASGSTTPGGGAVAAVTGASNLIIQGEVYIRGLTMNLGSGSSSALFQTGPSGTAIKLSLCKVTFLTTDATGNSGVNTIGGGGNGAVDFENCLWTWGSTNQYFNMIGVGSVRFYGVGGATAGSVPASLFKNASSGAGAVLTVEDMDLSASGSGKTLITQGNGSPTVMLHNCKLGASVTVASGSAVPLSQRVDVINCDSGATNYRNERYDYAGTLTTDTVDIRSGGASDGTTPIAHKVITTANANSTFPFECFDILEWWGTGIGSSHTISIPIMSNATLTNANIWPEVEYLGSASFPQGSVASGGLADPLATPANWATDSVSSWTTTGVSGPVKQTLSVSFTPQQAGPIRVRIKVAVASQTLRIDPLLQIV